MPRAIPLGRSSSWSSRPPSSTYSSRPSWSEICSLTGSRSVPAGGPHRERTAARSGVEDLAGSLDDGGLRAPREVDPAIGPLPDVLALDHGLRLLVDHRRAHVLDLVLDEGVDELDGPAGVRDVVGDEDLLGREIHRARDRREHDRHVEGGPDSVVELDVHHVQVLDREGVAEGAGQEQAAPGDREDQVGLEAVRRDDLSQLAGRLAEHLPAEILTLVVHGPLIAWSVLDHRAMAGRAD